MAALTIQIDDALKRDADNLFASLGLDTPAAIRLFLSAAVENAGIPFSVSSHIPNDDLIKAIKDTRNRENLVGPFDTVEEAMAAMLED